MGHFPNPQLSYAEQNHQDIHVGIFLKYEKVNGQWGFWMADEAWKGDNKIQKHFVSAGGTGKNNANNYRFIKFRGKA